MGLLVLISLGTAWVLQPIAFPTRAQQAIQQAVWALTARQFEVARAAAERALEINPHSAGALLLAGSAAAETRDAQSAIALLERVPADSRQSLQAELALARLWQLRSQVARSEQLYRRVLERDPFHREANRRLGFLLQSEGRSHESVANFANLIYLGDFGPRELMAVSSTERYFFTDVKTPPAADETAADSLTRLGEIRTAFLEGRERNVEPLLREIVSQHPAVAEAQGRLGRLIFETGNRGDFLDWNARLTAEHERHPEIWFVRGLFARREGALRGAVRCFLETLLRAPNHLAAHHQIGGCLLQLGERDAALPFLDRVSLLSRLDIEINLFRTDQTAQAAERLMVLLQRLGRHWEAAAWASIAARFGEPAPRVLHVGLDEAKKLRAAEGLTTVDSQPALKVDWGRFPLPNWSRDFSQPASTQAASSDAPRFDDWRFTEQAGTVGLDFEYYDGTTRETRLRHVFETFGGGVGVIDFDGDGWPDLYLTQANDWRRPAPESIKIDRLFRNLGAQVFADVTELSGLDEAGFSHGVAIGDYDDDGWPDVYVANLGPNRMYRNNGDGTFSEISQTTGTQGDEWSTSCALADLTGDGFADLFVVNYADRDYAARNPCFFKGIEISCTADRLPPISSRCYINLGDGRFADCSDEAGVLREKGLGLGLVVADFHGEGQPSVFVGNDTTPNFLFRNKGTDARGIPRFEEQGVISGLAFNAEGQVLASMGIAAGDANGDGRLDLFVTTFQNDSDKLFVQLPFGTFIDATRAAQLHGPTSAMLGFGAQFLDVDNDGWEDLVVTNGHVTPPVALGLGDDGDKMPPQVFANLGNGTFKNVSAQTLGTFFETKALGRGLAELDWDRDGRQDFCVSNIHSPVALVTNQTPTEGHRLVVRLVGTRSARDAFGAVGTVRVGTRTLTRHLAAGSGYLASNERRLWFGLGDADWVDELIITWPGGAIQQFDGIQADQEILIVENRTDPVILKIWPRK